MAKKSAHKFQLSRLTVSVLLIILLNSFISIGLIYRLRRMGKSKWNHQNLSQSTETPAAQIRREIQANPTVSLSLLIEEALLSDDHARFVQLIQSTSDPDPGALYSYSPANSGKHFVHMAPWNIPVLEALISSKHIDVNRNCILHDAIKAFNDNPDQAEYIETLLRHGADIDLPDSSGYAPLFYAIQRASIPATHFLLSHGAKVNIPFSSYSSTLHYAVAIRSPCDLIAILIEHGGNPFHRGSDGLTAFHHAMFLDTTDRFNIIDTFINTSPRVLYDPERYRKRLINYPISPYAVSSPSTRTFYGYTPLHLAVAKLDATEIVQLLLDEGADRDKKENDGFTPLELAQFIHHDDIIEMFQSQ